MKRTMQPSRTAAIVLVPFVLAACPFHHAPQIDPAATPHLDRVQPDSVIVPRGSVVEVLLVGRGFASGRPGTNTIEFAGMSITNVPASSAGDTIHFVIPDAVTRGGEAPPVALETGAYPIRVTTLAGSSNTLTVRVYR